MSITIIERVVSGTCSRGLRYSKPREHVPFRYNRMRMFFYLIVLIDFYYVYLYN